MCIFSNIKNLFNVNRLVESWNTPPFDEDYYNDSENDLKNIFLELFKLSERPISLVNQNYFIQRIKFLANEGIHIISTQDIKSKPTKVSKKDLEKIIFGNASKKTKVKKTTKKTKSNGR